MIRSFLISLILIVLSGCVTHRYNEGAAVRVRDTDGSHCNAAVIGKNLIVALGHCIDDGKTLYVRYRSSWYKAEAIQTYQGEHDTIIVLRVESIEWEPESWFALNPGGTPHLALTHHSGRMYWHRALSYPGDSGSPVIDEQGRLVGLIWGHHTDGTDRAIIEFLPKDMKGDSRWPSPRHVGSK